MTPELVRAQPTQKHLLRRRRRPVDLRLARRGSRQHPALRARLPGREGHSSRTELSQHRPHSRGRIPSHRAQRRPARQDAAHGRCARREGAGHRRLGQRARSPRHRRGDRAAAARGTRARRGPPARRDRHPGAGLVPDARIRRPLHPARPALSRDRRPALLRACRNPRRPRLFARDRAAGRRSRLRAHRQRAQARPR